MTKKVKNIIYKIELEGNGIVNADSSEQSYFYNGVASLKHMTAHTNNVNYAKKRFYKNDDGDVSYKLAITSDCMKHAMFQADLMSQSPNIIHNKTVFYSFIASPANILRGFCFLALENNKRKGAITLTDAIQTCGAISHLEVCARSGRKETDPNVKDNTFYKKEVVGDVKYAAKGNLDLMQLQFISVSDIFDRKAFNADDFELYSKFLKMRLKNFNSELKWYMIKDCSVKIPEHGFTLSNENVLDLVKLYFSRLIRLNITRRNAYTKISSLKYKLVYDVIDDNYENEDGWVEIKNQNDIDNINFKMEEFYEIEANGKAIIDEIEAEYKKQKSISKDKKDKEKAEKKEQKEKKSSKKADSTNETNE